MHLGSKRRRLCVAEQLLEVCVHWYPHHLRVPTHTHTHTFPGDHVRMRHTNESATYECTHTQTHTHAHMPSIHLTPASHIPNPHHISPIHTTRQTPLTPPSRNIAEICQNLHCSAYVWVTAHTNELCDFKKKESSAKNLSKSADISIRTIL